MLYFGRLFYHVVDTEHVASEIVRRINRLQLRGTVNFFSINRIVRKPVIDPTNEQVRHGKAKLDG